MASKSETSIKVACSSAPAKKRKSSIKAMPKAKLEGVPAARKRPTSKLQKEEKPKKVTKASLARAKLEEVRCDPHFGPLGEDAVKRIAKVYLDRMYLIHRHRHNDMLREEFDICGSTANVYKVTLAGQLSCSCIDFALRRNPCKHMLFVYLKVLRLPSHMPIYSRLTLSIEELREVFAAARQDPVAEAMASSHLRKAWETAVGYKPVSKSDTSSENVALVSAQGKRLLPTEGDACGVCYEDFEPGSDEGLEFCLKSCGRPIHKDCLANWINSRTYGPPTCIWCRAIWHDAPAHSSTQNTDRNLDGYGIGVNARGAVVDPNTGYQLNFAHIVALAAASSS